MHTSLVGLCISVALVLAPARLCAKGPTFRIVISGGDLSKQVEISDPAVVAKFRVWTGPGTSANEPQGLNVDWSQGVATPPKGLPVYNVAFFTTPEQPSTYIVRYSFDPATKQGYVYLPGKDAPEYRDNVSMIYRGVEGRWFHAWSEWENVAHRFIARRSEK